MLFSRFFLEKKLNNLHHSMVLKSGLMVSILLACFLTCTNTFAELVVIVHPSNTDILTKNDIKRIFLGNRKKFPGGDIAKPVVLNNDIEIVKKFYQQILGKSSSQYKSYWVRKIFTGRGNQPEAVTSQEMINLVANDSHIIGFIDSDSIDQDDFNTLVRFVKLQ